MYAGLGGRAVLIDTRMSMNNRDHTYQRCRDSHGFTLVEVVLVLIISAILVTVALRSGVSISDAAKVEETKQEMESLEFAIVGNPSLQNNGVRADFGYVGDIGALPPNLDALVANAGGYATWKGPYIKTRFTQTSDDYKRDAWGVLYSYSGLAVTSSGSGSNIVRTFGNTSDDLIRNTITGNVLDFDGTPPGTIYKDSVRLSLTIPDGIGGTTTRTAIPTASGYFTINSVPIGNQSLTAVYLPNGDTIATFMSILPGAKVNTELRFTENLWGISAPVGLYLINNSDSVMGSPPCTDVVFWIANSSSSAITVSTFSFTWPSPIAYYAEVQMGGTTVFNKDGSPRGVSGTTYTMTAPQTINAGTSVRIRVADFRQTNSNGGGSAASMSGATMTMVLSNGSLFTVSLPPCP